MITVMSISAVRVWTRDGIEPEAGLPAALSSVNRFPITVNLRVAGARSPRIGGFVTIGTDQ
jgi:hypothetical protein